MYLENIHLNNSMIDILDPSYLQAATLEELLCHENIMVMLKSSLYLKNLKISKEDFNTLISNGKLKIYDLSLSYDNVSTHDMVIYFANYMLCQGYTPTVYTCSHLIAIDLLAMDFSVKSILTHDLNLEAENDTNSGCVYFYDTCYFMNNYRNINYSKNIHVFPTSFLEELIPIDSKEKGAFDIFFKFLYIYNKFKENIKILFCPVSTQHGGRYSYTDLIHLVYFMNLSCKDELSGKVILRTCDTLMYTEVLCIPNLVVASGPNIIEENRTNIDVTNENEIKNETTNLDISKTKIEEEPKILDISQNIRHIKYITYNGNKIICNDMIKSVENMRFMYIKPLTLSKSISKQLNLKGNCYNVKVGYYLHFKKDPEVAYKITQLAAGTITLVKVS